MFKRKNDHQAEILARLDQMSKKLDAVLEVLADGGEKSAEKLLEEGIANLMSYDGAPKGMK